MTELSYIFRNAFQTPERFSPKVVQLIGASGRASCIFLLKRTLEAEAAKWKVSFKFVFVNLIHGE